MANDPFSSVFGTKRGRVGVCHDNDPAVSEAFTIRLSAADGGWNATLTCPSGESCRFNDRGKAAALGKASKYMRTRMEDAERTRRSAE
jgi:hypothetical protein